MEGKIDIIEGKIDIMEGARGKECTNTIPRSGRCGLYAKRSEDA
tara:strand:- start:677 stop:808 length:132 start_codon:yes stop_codon:yes gene_type:complete